MEIGMESAQPMTSADYRRKHAIDRRGRPAGIARSFSLVAVEGMAVKRMAASTKGTADERRRTSDRRRG